jgi:hypothetical protein
MEERRADVEMKPNGVMELWSIGVLDRVQSNAALLQYSG